MRHAFFVGLMLLATGSFVASESAHRTLTFEDRVKAQESIERIYYSHQIGATKSFDEAIPKAVIEAKVRKYLEQTAALDANRITAVTDEMLQHELDRMRHGTKMPERLREIYAALADDPLVTRECLARPILVERLLRQPSASDRPPSETAALDAAAPRETSACALDESWESMAATAAPTPRGYPSAVWTGSLMIVWGGQTGTGGSQFLGTGGRYDPATDSWSPVSTMNAPTARVNHRAVWTGSLMVVWGGLHPDYQEVRTGGRYDPVTDKWEPTSITDAPSERSVHTAVWTGSRMVVWGGENFPTASRLNTGGRYDPATDEWKPTSTAGAPSPRTRHVAVWTGSTMVIWGGDTDASINDGGRYDPSTDTWTPTSTSGAPAARFASTAVWTGHDMIVWGGLDFQSDPGGARYDPTADSWMPISTAGAPTSRRTYHTAAWTGTVMVVWGGYDYATGHALLSATGGGYDPVSDSWTPTTTTGAPSARTGHTGVWTGSRMLVWGGFTSAGTVNTGASYAPGASPIDADGDGLFDACDNCRLDFNPSQSDFDHDGEGDVCDLNDGLIYVFSTDKLYREWQADAGSTAWNSYRGSLAVLQATGQYTQAPGSHPLAARDCGVSDPYVFDPLVPNPDEVAFHLVTGVAGGVESSLGTNSAGTPRANANPCP